METKKKKYEPSADPDFDDFGVWLANRPKSESKGKGLKENKYKEQAKRMIEAERKKKQK